MDSRFEKLCENRKAYVQIAKKNGFYKGLKQLLTQLYPERAHFIFELLQNAEDAGASEVQFRLYQDYLEFEHDGKRLFDYSDVEAITGISQSTKKDDETAIGKFGIGFKSIYAYTSMPEIYSGEYSFSISESFIPIPIKGPQRIGKGSTLFVMPFDNPDKEAKKAYSEITEALTSLNFSSLLFLKNITTIRYTLGNCQTGMITRREEGPFTRISWNSSTGEEDSRIFLRFQKNVEIEDEDRVLKVCNIGVAYKVQPADSRKGKGEYTIVPMNRGVVSIYFPAVKETSNLKFNLNAPFASTVGRDSVRSCKGNDRLRDALAELTVESIRSIRDQGLLDIGFLACLPNEKDDLPPFYEPIRQRIVQAFREEDLTPLRKGGYAPAKILFKAPAKISDVFPDALFAKLMGLEENRVWAANAPQRNQRDDNFLDSLGIAEWDWSQLFSFIKHCDQSRSEIPFFSMNTKKEFLQKAFNLENLIADSSDDWLFTLYALLGEGITQHDLSVTCRNLKLIRTKSKDGISHVTPSDAYLPDNEMEKIDDNIYYVKVNTYENPKRRKESDNALAFLQKIDVRHYDASERVKLRLEAYEKGMYPDDATHLKDMILFLKYFIKNHDHYIFSDINFILGVRNGRKRWCKPYEIALDNPWIKTGLLLVINDIDKYLISSLYKNYFPEKSEIREKFCKFLSSVGCHNSISVKETSSIPRNIKILEMKNYGKITRYCIEEDHIIDGLEHILSNITVKKSLLIWKCLLNTADDEIKCRYSPNASSHVTTADASFIRQLKNAAWLPDKEGHFYKPEEITFENLHDQFVCRKINGCIDALGIGSIAKEQERQRKQEEASREKLDAQAREEGFSSLENKEKLIRLDKMLHEKGKTVEDVEDFLLSDKRKPEFPQHSVADIDRRRQKIIERINDAEPKTYVSRERRVRESKRNIDPRSMLRNLYTNQNDEMICQICRKEMPFRDRSGQSYFEAVELFTADLIDIEDEAMYIALCPICAAKYKEFVKADSKVLKNLLKNIHHMESFTDKIFLNLDNKNEVLYFVEKHWFDLFTVLNNLEIAD